MYIYFSGSNCRTEVMSLILDRRDSCSIRSTDGYSNIGFCNDQQKDITHNTDEDFMIG